MARCIYAEHIHTLWVQGGFGFLLCIWYELCHSTGIKNESRRHRLSEHAKFFGDKEVQWCIHSVDSSHNSWCDSTPHTSSIL